MMIMKTIIIIMITIIKFTMNNGYLETPKIRTQEIIFESRGSCLTWKQTVRANHNKKKKKKKKQKTEINQMVKKKPYSYDERLKKKTKQSFFIILFGKL